MPTQLEMLAEANRRGILPPEKKALYDEAVRRGLIQDNGSQPPSQQTIPDDDAADQQAGQSTPGQGARMDAQTAGGVLGRFRQKFPGYNDLDDATLAQRLAAKHPEYRDVAAAITRTPGNVVGPRSGGIDPGLRDFAAAHPETRFDFSQLNESQPAAFDRSQEPQATSLQPMLNVMRQQFPSMSPEQLAQAEASMARVAEIDRRNQAQYGTATPTASDMRASAAKDVIEATPRPLRPLVAGTFNSGMGSASLLSRLTDAVGLTEGLSGVFNETGGQMEQARRQAGTSLVEDAATGAVGSVTDMLTMGSLIPGGAASKTALGKLNQARGFIAASVARTTNDAVHKGSQAGLQGADLAEYAAQQGVIEGGITSVMQMVGLGGVEGAMAKEATKQTVTQALKSLGVTALTELPEELTIQLLQSWSDYANRANPNAIKDLPRDLAEVTLATLMTAGLAEAPHVYDAVRNRNVTGPQSAASGAPTAQDVANQIAASGQDAGQTTVNVNGQAANVPVVAPGVAEKARSLWDGATDNARRNWIGEDGYAKTPWDALSPEQQGKVVAATGSAKVSGVTLTTDQENGILGGFFAPEQVAAMTPQQRAAALDALNPQAKVTTADETTTATQTPRPTTDSLPVRPENLTKAQLLRWAADAGYNTEGLDALGGRRVVESEIDSQYMQREAARVMQTRGQDVARARAEQAQLPPDAESWDAGTLRRFAEENGYTLDERRIEHMVNTRGIKPREAVRSLIEEGYSLPKGEGKVGKMPARLQPGQQQQQGQQQTQSASRATQSKYLPALPTGATDWTPVQLKSWAKANGYTLPRIVSKKVVLKSIERQRAESQGVSVAPTKPRGLPPIPDTFQAGKGAFVDFKNWARNAGYQVEGIGGRGKLRRAIADQQDAAFTDLPNIPKESASWPIAQIREWAAGKGYKVSATLGRKRLTDSLGSQRARSIQQARKESATSTQSASAPQSAINAPSSKKTLKASPITDDQRDTLRAELMTVKRKLAEEQEARRTDEKTGAPNIVAYEEDAARIFKEADAANEHVAVVESDLGNFKVMNDELGHEVGDQVLKAEAESIREALRMPGQKGRPADYDGNVGYRTGGDEFPALLRNVETGQQALNIMQRVSDLFDAKVAEIIGNKLPKEAYPFIAWGVTIRKPRDSRDLSVMRHQADKGTPRPLGKDETTTAADEQIVNPHAVTLRKSAVKKERGVPESREKLQAYINANKAANLKTVAAEIKDLREQNAGSLARGLESAKTSAPVKGTATRKRERWWNRSLASAGRGLERLATPIASRIRDISPRVFGRLMRMQFDASVKTEQDKRLLVPLAVKLTESLGGKKSETYRAFKLHTANRDFDAARALLPADQHASFDEFPKVLERLHKDQKEAGVKLGRLENFWPRRVKDYNSLIEKYGSDKGNIGVFEEAWQLAEATKGESLSADEKVEVANGVLQGHGPIKPGNFGTPHARERSIDVLTDDQLDAYADPFESFMQYVDAANYTAEKAKFLGKSHDPAKLHESVGAIVEREAEHLTKEQQRELRDLLTVRLTADMLVVPKWARTTKQLIYLATLGQFRSAINQTLDIAITASKHGILNAGTGVRKALRFGSADTRMMLEDLGVHSHGEEFRDVGRVAKATDWVLKKTGFERIDRFGKENRANAAWAAFQQAANDPDSVAFKRLERDYKDVLGDQWQQTIDDLKAGEKTENANYIVHLDVAGIQPISLNQMPEKYLRMKSGRIFYALKSFTLTQLDNLRREGVRKATTPGTRREGLAYIAKYLLFLTSMGVGKDLLLDMLLGKPVDPDQVGDRALNALLTTVGLSRYMMGKATEDPIAAAQDFLMPPFTFVSAGWSDLTTGGFKKGRGIGAESEFKGLKSIRYVPLIGDLVYYWTPLGRGYYASDEQAAKEYNAKLKELHEDAMIAQQEGDRDEASALVAIYNDLRTKRPASNTRTTPVKPKPTLSLSRLTETRHRIEIKRLQQQRQQGRPQ